MPLKELEVRYATRRAKDYKLSDGEGLYLLVRPNGSKLWRMKYRYDAKEKLVYPGVSLAEARLKKAEARLALSRGVIDGGIANPVRNTTYIVPRDWMDAAINYTIPSGPLKDLGFSLQVQNLLASTRRSFYGYPDQPRDVIYMARVYGGRVSYKFK